MASSSEGLWRSGNLLVIQRGAQLPDRCIKTNQPAYGKRFKVSLTWHHPAIYLLLFSPIIYLIVAIAVSKTVRVTVGVTAETLQKRRTAILWAWGIGIAGSILFFYEISSQFSSSKGTFILLGIIMMLGGLIGGSIASHFLKVERIENEYVWIRGVSKEYLALLPKWDPEWASIEWNK
ncbi:hypothetical protein V2H45_12765 [Tumidithrix elongata RA019]|uniref:Uncharacterized protein n=1 Tax=Tumidithrix elongata BACA0141 TaxID=2716417 RepID=A0AAW9Q1C2_9CYAN|nr:hypothetical protein [Tumidithrix elongata RA019]